MTYYSEGALRRMGTEVRDKAISQTMRAGRELENAWRSYNTHRIEDGYKGKINDDPTIIDHHKVLQYTRSQYDDIPDLFADFAGANPSNSKKMIDIFAAIVKGLTVSSTPSLLADWKSGKMTYSLPSSAWTPEPPLSDRLENITRDLGNDEDNNLTRLWKGEAAEAFATYLRISNRAIESQREIAGTIAAAYQAHQALLDAVYVDVKAIYDSTMNALDAVGGGFHTPPFKVVITVATAVLGVAAVFAAPPVGAAVLTATQGVALANTATTFVNGLHDNVHNFKAKAIGAPTVPGIIGNMRDLQVDVLRTYGAQQNNVATALGNVIQQATNNRRFIEIQPPNDIASMKNANKNTLEDVVGFHE